MKCESGVYSFMKPGGLLIFCPSCSGLSSCRAIPPYKVGLPKERRWSKASYNDIRWFRRVRECQICTHKFVTAEINESLLAELVRLRDQLAEENQQKSQELLDLHAQIEEHNRKVIGRIRTQDNWVFREEKIPLEIAEEFIRRSAWWLNHPSGKDVRAPRYAENIYKSNHGWTVEFGANKFLVGMAIERCRRVISAFCKAFGCDQPRSLIELKEELALKISGSVANYNNEEYEGCYPIYYDQLVFGNAAIDIPDATQFLLEESGVNALFIK